MTDVANRASARARARDRLKNNAPPGFRPCGSKVLCYVRVGRMDGSLVTRVVVERTFSAVGVLFTRVLCADSGRLLFLCSRAAAALLSRHIWELAIYETVIPQQSRGHTH